MVAELRVKPTFGGHEKFVFRQSWLKKGVDALYADPAVFAGDEALVTLGVGKNMVRSIRHWCLATNLFSEPPEAGRGRGLSVSPLGEKIFGPEGWDPYLEDTATLWLLHWQLATNVHRALVWEILFSRFFEAEFTKKQLGAFVGKQLERMLVATTPGTVEREVDVLLRTYVPASRSMSGAISEETMDCPLVELDLLRFVPDDNIYRFHTGPKATLPVEVFGYGLLHYLKPFVHTRRTVHVDECVYSPGSPGQIFRLNENSVVEYLESLEEVTGGALRLQETAGLPQLYLHGYSVEPLDTAAVGLLAQYYG